jgi:hypothetical protein
MVPSYLPVCRQQRRKPPPGTAWARVVAAEFLDELGVLADDAVTALDPGLARGNPLRRLLVGSKGRLGVEVAVHDCLLGCAAPTLSAVSPEFGLVITGGRGTLGATRKIEQGERLMSDALDGRRL